MNIFGYIKNAFWDHKADKPSASRLPLAVMTLLLVEIGFIIGHSYFVYGPKEIPDLGWLAAFFGAGAAPYLLNQFSNRSITNISAKPEDQPGEVFSDDGQDEEPI